MKQISSNEFNSNTNRWIEGTFTNDFGTQTYTIDGSYKWGLVAKKGVFPKFWADQAPSVEDFIVSVDATRVSGAENASYGIVYHIMDFQP